MRIRLHHLAIILTLLISACSKEITPQSKPEPEPEPVPESKRTYTIMFYCCGGELDKYNEDVIDIYHWMDTGIAENINVVGQIKWSEGYNSENSDPACEPMSAMAGVTRPKMMRGMMNPRN